MNYRCAQFSTPKSLHHWCLSENQMSWSQSCFCILRYGKIETAVVQKLQMFSSFGAENVNFKLSQLEKLHYLSILRGLLSLISHSTNGSQRREGRKGQKGAKVMCQTINAGSLTCHVTRRPRINRPHLARCRRVVLLTVFSWDFWQSVQAAKFLIRSYTNSVRLSPPSLTSFLPCSSRVTRVQVFLLSRCHSWNNSIVPRAVCVLSAALDLQRRKYVLE